MSHFTVLVIGENVEEQLAPHDEQMRVEPYWRELPSTTTQHMREYISRLPETERDEWNALTDEQAMERYYGEPYKFEGGRWCVWSTYNPKSKWDWWIIGGRWTGQVLKLKVGALGELGAPGAFDNQPRDGWVDQALKGDVDWEGMAHQAAEAARAEWRAVHAIIDQFPPFESWKSILASTNDIKATRSRYYEQPAVAALNNATPLSVFDDPDSYLVSEDEFARRAAFRSGRTFAVVRNGVWYERKRLEIAHDDTSDIDWSRQFMELLGSVADDEVLTVIDCHI